MILPAPRQKGSIFMSHKISGMIAQLELFCIEGDYLAQLRRLTDQILSCDHPEQALPAMLAVIERYPDEELGSPGPLVHAIEKCSGYEEALLVSVERCPASLTVWMIYRLYCKEPQSRYLNALKGVLTHPKASATVQEDAQIFLSWSSL